MPGDYVSFIARGRTGGGEGVSALRLGRFLILRYARRESRGI